MCFMVVQCVVSKERQRLGERRQMDSLLQTKVPSVYFSPAFLVRGGANV